MALEEYRKRRNFRQTPEPTGTVRRSASSQRIFVVHRHHASRPHYDVRLEINGVLASWAVPKGPSMKPADKQLAVRTEDHPIDYADFEGVIPEGQYGAGVVMVWDKGSYEPEGELSPEEQVDRGKVKVVLHGMKLQGGFVLVRLTRRLGERGGKKNWLLIKQRDEYADPSWQIDDRRLDHSVLTGRTMREIEENRRAKRRVTSITAKLSARNAVKIVSKN